MRAPSTERGEDAPRARRMLVRVVAALLLLGGALPAGASETRGGMHRAVALHGHGALSPEESRLLDALELVAAGNLDGALSRLRDLVERRHRYELAERVYADLLAVKARPRNGSAGIDGVGAGDLEALREEALARLRHELTRASRRGLPESLISVAGRYRQAVVVDVSAARLYLFELDGGEPRVVADYYVSTGRNGSGKVRQNDQRTPVGVYFITGRIDGDELPEFYGAGALPVDYPNPWDRRLEHTGYGIWIHGSPAGTYSRAPFASDGCIALANADLAALWNRLVWERVPVVIADSVSWWPRATLAARAELLAGRVEQWRAAWQSGDAGRYAALYSRDFESDGGDLAAWMRRHRAAGARQRDVEIEVSNLGLLGLPGDYRVVIATFDQAYRSADRALVLGKQQYWRLEDDGVWRIVYEGVARVRREHVKGIPVWARSKMY